MHTARGRLRIAHVITRFIRGGADENTLLSCNAQAALGHDVTLFVGREYHKAMVARLSPQVQLEVLTHLVRPIHPIKDARCLLDLAYRLRAKRYDLVHTHESKAGILGRIAARLAAVPTIVHGVHILAHLNAGPAASWIYLAAERLAARLTHVFVSVSPAMREACLATGLGSPQAHLVVESGMDVARYANASANTPAVEQSIAQLSPERPSIVLMASALEPRKRVLEFVEVFAKLAPRTPNACLLIAGEGPLRRQLEALIANLGLDGRIVCLGHREDLENFIARADVCVHAAASEGLPRVAVQYVAAGKPIVATALPGLDSLVVDGSNGALVEAGNLEALAEPLHMLLSDEDARARACAFSRGMDVSAWSIGAMIAGLEEAYELAQQRSGTAAIRLDAERNPVLQAAP